MKHLIILASIAILTIGAAACTREKPTNETPAPQVAASDLTTTPGAATPVPGSTSAPTDTPVVTSTVIVTATSAPTAVLPTSVPVVPVSTPTPSAPASAPGTYTVQWGDWLNKIAQQFGVSTQAIVDANPGLNPNLIYPGQVLKIPAPGTTPPSSGGVTPPTTNPGTYTVQRGDWIYAIARRFGVTVPALLAANPGINPNFVFPGQVLSIPGSGGTTPPPPGPAGSYTVQPGDTLFSIAVRFRTTTYALQIANHLANPNFIYPGQVLTIPQ